MKKTKQAFPFKGLSLLDELEKECLTAIKYIEALKVKDLSTTQKEDILGELSASITHLRIQTEQLDKTFDSIEAF
jgi:hypothetical protein